MRKLSLKGCKTKEKTDFIKEIELDKTHKDYRYLMGWHNAETEKIFSHSRANQLPKIKYQFYGQFY